METDGGSNPVRQQLDEIERGEVASWISYPPTPVWWPVAFGLWVAAFALVTGLLEGTVQSLALAGLVAVVSLFVWWDRRRRGSYPAGRPPQELQGAVLRMLLGAAVVAASAWLAGEQVSVWLAAGLAGVGGGAVVARYEHEYAAAAARVRERLT